MSLKTLSTNPVKIVPCLKFMYFTALKQQVPGYHVNTIELQVKIRLSRIRTHPGAAQGRMVSQDDLAIVYCG